MAGVAACGAFGLHPAASNAQAASGAIRMNILYLLLPVLSLGV